MIAFKLIEVLHELTAEAVATIEEIGFDYDSGMWHALETDCSYCKENVTHWMPLPAPPAKLSNVEKIGKEGL